MRKLICLLLLLLPVICFANGAHSVEVVVNPTKPLTKNWIFVVDTSDSMSGVFHKALAGIRRVTRYPTDEWSFKVITFNNRGMTRRTKWVETSVDTLDAAKAWIENPKFHGVNSHGLPAIKEALRADKEDLTIILITDGGFTSACENRGFGKFRQEIADGQAWRVKNKLGKAIITTIGASNTHYSAWCTRCIRPWLKYTPHNYSLKDWWFSNKGQKPSDKDCQAFLSEIGSTYEGGYLLVRSIQAHASKRKSLEHVRAAIGKYTAR